MTEQNEPLIIEGKENVRKFTLLQVAHALSLEIVTGMKISSRGSALDAARIQGVIPKGKRTTKHAALVATIDAIKELVPDYEPSASIKRALAK